MGDKLKVVGVVTGSMGTKGDQMGMVLDMLE